MNKANLLFLLSMSIFSFLTSQAKAGAILRNADGSVRYMTWFEASGVNPDTAKKENPDACEAAGKGHLPTVRELAKLAWSRGAKGILEMNHVDPDKEAAFFSAGWRL
ncbi:MAG: hypothetical protein ACAH59_03460, partial [Pseudobdellovibrionaceae bacterium]